MSETDGETPPRNKERTEEFDRLPISEQHHQSMLNVLLGKLDPKVLLQYAQAQCIKDAYLGNVPVAEAVIEVSVDIDRLVRIHKSRIADKIMVFPKRLPHTAPQERNDAQLKKTPNPI